MRSAFRLRTVMADTIDDQPVRSHTELMLPSHFVPHGNQGIILKFQQSIALGAVKVVVLGIAVIMFINGPAVERKLSQQARIDKFGQGSIDRRPADMPFTTTGGKLFHELIRVKVLMSAEHMVYQRKTLLGHSHPTAL